MPFLARFELERSQWIAAALPRRAARAPRPSPAGSVTRSWGSRLARPYHFRAQIQSFQALAAPFPDEPEAMMPSRAAIPATGTPRFKIIDDRLFPHRLRHARDGQRIDRLVSMGGGTNGFDGTGQLSGFLQEYENKRRTPSLSCQEIGFLLAWEATSACGAPLSVKMVAARADLSEPSQRAIVLRLTKLRWLATPIGSPARAA